MLNERGADIVEGVIRQSVISTINLAEVYAKLDSIGPEAVAAGEVVLKLLGGIAPYTAEQAKIAGFLRAKTRGHGLSLGDRSCLAVGISLGLPVYTAEHIWRKVSVGCEILLIRTREDETSVQ